MQNVSNFLVLCCSGIFEIYYPRVHWLFNCNSLKKYDKIVLLLFDFVVIMKSQLTKNNNSLLGLIEKYHTFLSWITRYFNKTIFIFLHKSNQLIYKILKAPHFYLIMKIFQIGIVNPKYLHETTKMHNTIFIYFLTFCCICEYTKSFLRYQTLIDS